MLPKEKEYRKKELLCAFEESKKNRLITNRYYQLSHEIRSLEFLEKYENFKVSNDHSNESGSDFSIYNTYKVECICCSAGKEKDNIINTLKNDDDYYNVEEIMLTRLTSCIKEKKDFYIKHLENGTILPGNPYIIFLGLGELAEIMITGSYGRILNKILLGMGYQRFLIDTETSEIKELELSHNYVIKKYSNKKISPIDCNIFYNEDYSCISAIIFATTNLEQEYNYKNTFIFINPYAKYRIYAKRFPKLIYWKSYKKLSYIPRYKGKKLKRG